MSNKTGPKTAALDTPLDLPRRNKRNRNFDDFCRRFFVLKSKKGPAPLKPRPWQLDIVASFFDSGQIRLAGLQIGRGNGKSSLLAAIGAWDLFCGQYGANICLTATDERQAGIIFDTVKFAVEHSPELAARAQIYRDKIIVPSRAATLRVLPAASNSLEGLDFSLAILDEAGFASNDTFATLLDSQGKREQSILCLIGTPGPNADSPLGNLREQARTDPDDLTAWVEFSSDDDRSHPWDCQHCLEAANPALGDFLHRSGVDAARPPKVSVARWERVRLGRWVTGNGDGWIDRTTWMECQDERVILPGASVVLAVDGSRVSDSTALVMVSVEDKPIVQLMGLWQPHLQDDDYRIPVADVENRIRAISDIYNVVELTGDPAQGWGRSFSILRDEGFKVVEFPNSPSRMIPATANFKLAVEQGEVSHDGNEQLAAHVSNAVMYERERGYQIHKPSEHSPRKIDAAVTAVMAHSRAKWHATQKLPRNQFRSIRIPV